MIIFLRELLKNRKQLVIWTLSLIGFNILFMAFYPTMADQSRSFSDIIKSYPKGLTSAIGMDKLNFAKILSYFAYVFQYLILFGNIYATMLGASILSKEESEGTIEFLLAKPVKRSTIVTAKSLCVLVYLLLLNVFFVLANYIIFEILKREDYSMKLFFLLPTGFFLAQATFASIGLFISVFIVKAKSVYPVSLVIVLGAYILNIASALSDKLANLKYLTPFKYISPSDLVTNGRIEGVYLVIMFAVIAVMVGLTYVFYERKNIRA